jgi:hypothetical protein
MGNFLTIRQNHFEIHLRQLNKFVCGGLTDFVAYETGVFA